MNKHTSVIQSTGLVPNVNPLSLVNQAKKETFLKLIVPSPDLLKAGNKNTSEEPSPLTIDVRSNRVRIYKFSLYAFCTLWKGSYSINIMIVVVLLFFIFKKLYWNP